jgi:hypothetical protein
MLYECLIDLMILAKDGPRAKVELSRALPLLIAGLIGITAGNSSTDLFQREALEDHNGRSSDCVLADIAEKCQSEIQKREGWLCPGRSVGRISLRQHRNA